MGLADIAAFVVIAVRCTNDAAQGNPTSDDANAAWVDDQAPAKFKCLAAHAAGITVFTVLDTDGDSGMDLHDHGDLQNAVDTGFR